MAEWLRQAAADRSTRVQFPLPAPDNVEEMAITKHGGIAQLKLLGVDMAFES